MDTHIHTTHQEKFVFQTLANWLSFVSMIITYFNHKLKSENDIIFFIIYTVPYFVVHSGNILAIKLFSRSIYPQL